MNKNIIRFVSHECLADIPDTFVVGLDSAPTVLHHVVAFAVLVGSGTEDLHTVIIGGLPVVISLLTHFLRNLFLRQRFLGQLGFLLVFTHANPFRHVASRQVSAIVCIRYDTDSFARETDLTHVSAPSHRVTMSDRVVNDLHQLVNR